MYRAKMVQWFDVIGHSTGFKKRWTLKALKAQAADAHTSTSVPHKSVKCIVLKYSCSIFSFLLFLVNFIISFSFFFLFILASFPSFRIFYSCTRIVSIFNVYFICSLPLLPPPPPFYLSTFSSSNRLKICPMYFSSYFPHSLSDSLLLSSLIIIPLWSSIHCSFFFFFLLQTTKRIITDTHAHIVNHRLYRLPTPRCICRMKHGR